MAFNRKQRLRDNIEAIRTAFILDRERRTATAEEQAILRKYCGFGGLKCILNPAKEREAFIRKLLPPVGNVFSAYDLSDDNFALSPEYDLLYTELTGAAVLYIDEYGV